MATGRLKATLEGHSQIVNAVAISPDGLTCVSGSDDKTVRCAALFEVCTGPPVHVGYCKHTNHNHPLLAHTPHHTTPPLHRLWDMATGRLKATLEGHSSYVRAVAISPDGLTCVSGSKDKTVRCAALFEACTCPPVHVWCCKHT